MANNKPDSISWPKWLRFISLYGVFILSLLVLFNHFRMRTKGLSSWKGGGFGMYADYHPVFTKVFVKSKKPLPAGMQIQHSKKAVDLMDKIRIYPKDEYLRELQLEYQRISGLEGFSIEVWQPIFNPDSLVLKLELAKEYSDGSSK